MVVLAIIVILTGIVLTSQSTFNKTLVLANTAYDIALTLRTAETYGLGSRAFGSSANAGYGIDFNHATPGSFTLFADTNLPNAATCHGLPTGGASAPDAQPGNCIYDGASEQVTDYMLGNAVTVSDFCAYALGSWTCAASHGSTLTSLDMSSRGRTRACS